MIQDTPLSHPAGRELVESRAASVRAEDIDDVVSSRDRKLSMRALRITWTPYSTVTAVMCLFITAAAVPDLARTASALRLIHQLGYPDYFLQFIGVMKLLGVAAVIYPRFPRLKEWAYAGLVFDTGGALYSHWQSHTHFSDWAPALLGLALVAASYSLYRRQARDQLV